MAEIDQPAEPRARQHGQAVGARRTIAIELDRGTAETDDGAGIGDGVVVPK
jgi:hypothetical protein